MTTIMPAAAGDAPHLATMHASCLPGSILTSLGGSALETYYAMVTGSPLEHVLIAVHTDGDRQAASSSRASEIAAACVLSLSPQTVLRRFALRSPARLVRALATAAVRTPGLRTRLRSRVSEAVLPVPSLLEMAGDPTDVPEVTQIFTDARHRGHGVGQALLRACEAYLRDLGHLGYCIHTLRDDNDAGIRFYRRQGFTLVGTSRSFGDHYLVMKKGLS